MLILFSLAVNAQQDFSRLKWKNRILIFSTPALDSPKFREQWNAFQGSPKKIEDRNIKLFVLVKGRILDQDLKAVPQMDVSALRKKYGLPAGTEGFVLIGKDGGVKERKNFVTDPKVIFSSIDNMPMRQQEMKENLED